LHSGGVYKKRPHLLKTYSFPCPLPRSWKKKTIEEFAMHWAWGCSESRHRLKVTRASIFFKGVWGGQGGNTVETAVVHGVRGRNAEEKIEQKEVWGAGGRVKNRPLKNRGLSDKEGRKASIWSRWP